MSRPAATRTGPHVAAQTAASWAAFDAALRKDALDAGVRNQDRAFWDALGEMHVVEEFIGKPEHILGRENTKHGEISEQFHVASRRAWDVLHHRTPTANISDVPRTGRADYIENGMEIQSKYYNGLRATLGGVTGHARNHPDFVTDAGRYHIPKDQFQQLSQLGDEGTIDGLSARSVARIGRRVESLQQETGRSIDELIDSGEARYDEVTRGRIHRTIDDQKNTIANENEDLKDQARAEHAPGLAGAATAAALGAAAGGGVSLVQAMWVKMREGKNPFQGDFSYEDWKDVGLDTAKGAGTGAVAGGTLYFLTNATDLAAPFAGSLVSGLIGIGNLLGQYHTGRINDVEFVDLSLMAAAESAIVGLSVAAGQILIPIPMLGAVVGSIAGKVVSVAIKGGLGEAESSLIERLKTYEAQSIANLDDALRGTMVSLDSFYARLVDLAYIAFDETVNTDLILAASIQMAETLDVPEGQILRSTAALDAFIEE